MDETKRAERARDISIAVAGGLAVLGAIAFALSPLFPDAGPRGGAAEWHAFSPSSATGSAPEVLWPLPPFTATDHRGAPLSSASLAGTPYIANFIFTTCTNACPMMTSRMVLLQRGLVDVDLRFVSFSVDPAHDTPAAMATYQQQWHASEHRWSLVPTTPALLQQLVAAFHIVVEDTGSAADPILHSEVFFLVDARGDVRGIYSSRDSEALQRLQRDARAVVSTPALTTATAPATVAGLGCLGCHASARIAPPLADLLGAHRELTDGRSVVVDEAYLRRAVTSPSQDVVKGYPATMPNYTAQLDARQLDALIAELVARTGGQKAPAGEVRVVVDPVCKMEVRTEPDTPHAHVAGHDVWFCAEVCRDAYLKDPSAFPL